MNHKLASGFAALGLVFGSAGASGADYTDYAPVISAVPIFERVNVPRQECWNEVISVNETRQYREAPVVHSPGGAILGGIVGGIIGHQVGRGFGRGVATAVGAFTGAVVGDQIGNDGRHYYPPSAEVISEVRPRNVQRCRTIESAREEIRGYNVTYRFNGRDLTVRMPYDPGPQVRVAVSVIDEPRPVGRPAPYPAYPMR